jgi:hypothetical protein
MSTLKKNARSKGCFKEKDEGVNHYETIVDNRESP